MRIIIVGAGEVGSHLSESLSVEGHEVVLIDRDSERLRRLEKKLDLLTIVGNGASAQILEQGGIAQTDLFIAVTNIDEVNLVASILSREYGVKHRVARVRNEEFLSPGSPLNERRLGLDLLINPDRVMAAEIMRLTDLSEAFEFIDFAGGQVVLLGYRIKEKNPICGLTLEDLREIRGIYDFVIVSIVRANQAIIPRGQDIIEPGDSIYLVARHSEIPTLEYLLNLTSKAPQRVFIIGGGRVGSLVAQQMESKRVDVRLVEKDPVRCHKLSETLGKTIVLNLDGLESRDLLDEGIDRADLVISVTGDDDTNILTSLLAKHHGTAKCITRIDRPDFIPLLEKLGIDMALSPRLLAASTILKFVRRGSIVSVASLLGTDAEVLEMVVPDKARFRKRPIKELGFPHGANMGAVVRNGQVFIPTGDTVLEPGDDVVVFSLRDSVREVERFFKP
ncbi:MAG: Trk system potassium transport protein TrkA [Deltaproteobacteria bacterium RBG_13_43_22]|nr:MAG: Trk system potassium transport protein TrkA [Deltaproteobacteria bacterium RBG_13_43_22]